MLRKATFAPNVEVTAVGATKAESAECGGWHDLSGRTLESRPRQKGIYVNNGKIEIVK